MKKVLPMILMFCIGATMALNGLTIDKGGTWALFVLAAAYGVSKKFEDT